MPLKIVSRVCLLFFIYILVSYFYIGLFSVPTEGDSLNYHIPIAHSYLEGNILNPQLIQGVPFFKYSPGASEGVLALLYFLHIPPGLFNVLGVIVFFFALSYLGKTFSFQKEYRIIFATSIATLNGIVRWMDTQIIDIYLGAFFIFSIALLQKPERKLSYFIKLGIVIGVLLGTKFSAVLFVGILGLVYLLRIIPYLSLKRFVGLIVPIFIFGVFWYIRNLMLLGNPIYPQKFLMFPGTAERVIPIRVFDVVTNFPFGFFGTINAFISEYMVWCLSVPLVLFLLIRQIFSRKSFFNKKIVVVLIVGILNFGVYLILPSDYKDYIMVSVIRYSYAAVIPFILALFYLARKSGKEYLIGMVAIMNMFFVSFPQTYSPKLIFVMLPITLFIFREEITTFLHKGHKAVKK